MRIVIYTDNSLGLQTNALVEKLNFVCNTIKFFSGQSTFRLEDKQISHPATYKKLDSKLVEETQNFDLAILCTAIGYDNNYFFEGFKNQVIVAFNDWNRLTDLPISNGLVYFAGSLITDLLNIGKTHRENTGCLKDFWRIKTGIDSGMRSAYLCAECRAKSSAVGISDEMSNDIDGLLDLVSQASRLGEDITNFNSPHFLENKQSETSFDLFICHNGDDKPEVREIVNNLKSLGIKTWFDEEQIPAGMLWQPALEQQIEEIKAAAVFVGSNGIGPWHEFEIRAFLSEFMNRKCPVIPIILPSANSVPKLPIFLSPIMWIDMRESRDEGIDKLLATLRYHS